MDATGRFMTLQTLHCIDSERRQKLRWLNLYRIVFTSILLCSTLFIHFSKSNDGSNPSLIILYVVILTLFLLSLFYSLCLPRIVREDFFSYFQITIDSVVVTLILLVTGSFESVFSFLYLVIIIYTSRMYWPLHSVAMTKLPRR